MDLMAGTLNLFGIACGAYLDNKSLGKSGFFQKVISCDRNCNQCDYCEKLASRLIRLKVLTREKLVDLGGPTGIKEVIDKIASIEKLP